MKSAIAVLLITVAAKAQSVGTFVPTGSMTTARAQHTATLLNDGRVLITGGPDNSAELYDPSTGTFSRTGFMHDPRRMHSATLLQDGSVLVAGGWGLTSAEIYDPVTGTFTPTGSLLEDQGGHTAIRLPDGRVLIAGGERSARPWPTAARAELYDPTTRTFSFAFAYATTETLYASGGPIWPTSNSLHDGRVLIVGENPAEIYDPVSGTFSAAGKMIESSYLFGMEWQASTTLHDGTVLVTGGNDDMTCGGFRSAEIYDPASATFNVVGPMTEARDIHTSTILNDGTVLITGGGEGWCGTATHDSAELYIPATRTFIAAGHMSQSRTTHTATLLKDGSVLIAGGSSYWPHDTMDSAELYRPIQIHSGRRLHR